MSIQSLRASLALLDATPNAQLSHSAPPRTIYHQISQDVMLVQGIHYAVEEALANVGELVSSDPLVDPRRRCLLRLQQNLTDIARISENVQERMSQNIINHASTSGVPIIVEEELAPQPMTESCGSALPPTTSVPTPPPCIPNSDEAVVFRWEPLLERSDSRPATAPPPPENLVPLYQTVLESRLKRKASEEDDNHAPKPSPAKRPRRNPNGSTYLLPTPRQKEERTSVFGWARRMYLRSKQ